MPNLSCRLCDKKTDKSQLFFSAKRVTHPAQQDRLRTSILVSYVCLGRSSIGAGSDPEFNSNADYLTKIRSVLEEFRQDIIHKDGYALTKLVLNPNVFGPSHRLTAVPSLTPSSRRVPGAVSQSLRVISLSTLSENCLSSSAPRAIHTLLRVGAKVVSATIGVELPAHPFFLATLFVPQSRSRPERTQPIVTAFLKVGRGT